jgi:hypothetical protein
MPLSALANSGNTRRSCRSARCSHGAYSPFSDCWWALGDKPEAALNDSVTLSVDAAKPQEAPLVTDKKIHLQGGQPA